VYDYCFSMHVCASCVGYLRPVRARAKSTLTSSGECRFYFHESTLYFASENFVFVFSFWFTARTYAYTHTHVLIDRRSPHAEPEKTLKHTPRTYRTDADLSRIRTHHACVCTSVITYFDIRRNKHISVPISLIRNTVACVVPTFEFRHARSKYTYVESAGFRNAEALGPSLAAAPFFNYKYPMLVHYECIWCVWSIYYVMIYCKIIFCSIARLNKFNCPTILLNNIEFVLKLPWSCTYCT